MVITAYGEIPDSELITEVGFPNSKEFPSPKLSYFVGYMCGDAGLKDIRRSKELTGKEEFKIIVGDEFQIQVELLRDLFKQLFNKDTKIRTERKEKGINFYYFNPTSNGKDNCWKIGTGSKKVVKRLNSQKIFIQPIKRWRIEKLSSLLTGM